jgi:hypothetical protein
LQTRGVTAELLKTGIADGNRAARTVKLKLHTIILMNVSCRVTTETENNQAVRGRGTSRPMSVMTFPRLVPSPFTPPAELLCLSGADVVPPD